MFARYMTNTILEVIYQIKSTTHIEMQWYQPLMSTQEFSMLVDCIHIPWDTMNA